jgi:hypothetical protein
MVRWRLDDIIGTLDIPQPEGLVELWDALPQGTTTTASALESARRKSQTSIAQGLTLVGQKVVAAAGVNVGYRPELFAKLQDLPGVDVLKATAIAVIEGNFDLGQLVDAAQKLLRDIVKNIGERTGAAFVQPDFAAGIGHVVAVVWWAVETIVTAEKNWAAYQKALADAGLECIPPAYSAKLDLAQVEAALAILAGADWRDLFLPEVRPFDPDYLEKAEGWGPDAGLPESGWLDQGWRGFTCCRTPDGGRVITPVGNGIGNRIQSSFTPIYYGHSAGFGMLPMCADLPIFRAIITPPGGLSPYEPARVLAQTAGVGQQVWRLLWNGGPSAFAVPPGKQIAGAWSETFGGMRHFIASNEYGIGGNALYDRRVCDDWSAAGRQRALEWFFARIGMPDPAGAAQSEGIVGWSETLPVKAWTLHDEFAHALLGRLGIIWTDANTCAPEWRDKVREAQAEFVNDSTAPCEVPFEQLDSVPDPALRQAIKDARKARPPVCHASAIGKINAYTKVGPSDGLSLAPIGENDPGLPSFPTEPEPEPEPRPSRPSRPSRGSLGASSSSSGGGGAVAAAAIVTTLLLVGLAATK